jgi:sporulation protein YlmC with PRC-barrel domain
MTERIDGGGVVLVQASGVTGRSVVDPGRKKVGTIRDLVLGRHPMTVRYFAVDLGLFRKQVLVPAEEISESGDEFSLLRWTADELNLLPTHEPARKLSEEWLEELRRAHPRAYGDLRDAEAREPSTILPIRDARDIQLPREAPNLKGWNVFGADGERIGTVTDMLVDTQALRIAYLDVDLLQDLYTLSEDRHVLIPMEAMDLKERGQDVWLKDTPARALSRVPAYTGGSLDPALEPRIREVFSL